MHPERGYHLKQNKLPQKLARQLKIFRVDGNTTRVRPTFRLLHNVVVSQVVLKQHKIPQEEQIQVSGYPDNEGLAENKLIQRYHLHHRMTVVVPMCATPTRSQESCISRRLGREFGVDRGSLAVEVLCRRRDGKNPLPLIPNPQESERIRFRRIQLCSFQEEGFGLHDAIFICCITNHPTKIKRSQSKDGFGITGTVWKQDPSARIKQTGIFGTRYDARFGDQLTSRADME
ncbi:hypothetical protein ACHAWU_005924 [Discostella pseudostelligera]|uniref:Uncharacterized protein n=1 Tax=Discostella pseudostelligera TaxID=259834 RepID=A0ABD3LYS2_9STRA